MSAMLSGLANACMQVGRPVTPTTSLPPTSTPTRGVFTPTPTPVPLDMSAEYEAQTFAGVPYPYAIAFDGTHLWVSHFNEARVSKMGQDGQVAASVPVGQQPRTIAYAAGYVWVGNGGESTVTKIDPATARVIATYTVGGGFSAPVDIEYDGAHLWVVGSWGNSMYQMTVDGAVLQQVPMRGGHPSPWDAALDDQGNIWVANLNIPEAQKFDKDGRMIGRYNVGPLPPGQEDNPGRGGEGPDALVFDGRHMWVAVNWLNRLVQLTTTGETVREVAVGRWPYYLAIDGRYVWSVDFGADAVSRVDVATGQVGRLPVGKDPTSMAVAGDNLWVANSGDNSVTKITRKRGGQ